MMHWSVSKSIRLIATDNYQKALEALNLDGEILLMITPSLAKSGHTEHIRRVLAEAKFSIYSERINNPDIQQIEAIADLFRDRHFDAIIAIGGGSIIDTAKVLSLILHPSMQIESLNFLKTNDILKFHARIPVFALPSTSGTGAECTQFATVWDLKNKQKYSLESPLILPEQVILDPHLVVGLPEEQTLFTGLDALSHATESLWNKNQNPLAKAFAKEAIDLIDRYFLKVLNHADDLDARAQMQYASYLAGLAISITKTAIAHAISYPLTYRYNVPHGLACSFSIPAIFKYFSNQIHQNLESISELEKSAKLIKSFDLKRHLERYLSLKELLAIVSEMNNPQRFSNFILTPSMEDLFLILKEAMD